MSWTPRAACAPTRWRRPTGRDDLQTWLDRRRVPQAWRLASALAGAAADPGWCDRVEAVLPGADLHPALEWVANAVAVDRLLAEVRESTHRVSELVSAVRSYSQMDRASRQRVQVTDGLENTLVMLGHKLRDGITVVRAYADDLPQIDADPGELNQVWTNLIDNAADAMAGSGSTGGGRAGRRRAPPGGDQRHRAGDARGGRRPRLRAVLHHQGGRPAAPGLGLDISPPGSWWSDMNGTIEIDSTPGATVIRVRLPL